MPAQPVRREPENAEAGSARRDGHAIQKVGGWSGKGTAERRLTIPATAGSVSGTAAVTVAQEVNAADRAALVALHEATDGPNWVNNDNWLTDATLMIALYCEPQTMQGHLQRLLPPHQCRRVDSRGEFQRALLRFGTGVFGTLKCSRADAEWLARLVDDSPHVKCIAVVPLSLTHLQSLRPFLSDRLKVVWLEEAREELLDLVNRTRAGHDNPLHRLAYGILAFQELSPVAKKALVEICCPMPPQSNDMRVRPAPPRNMNDLASRVHHSISGIRAHWTEQVPLRCTPKRLMEWAMLIWAVGDRVFRSASARARHLGIHPRTLERICARLMGCRIGEALHDPAAVHHRFDAWLDEVLELPLDSTMGDTGL